MWISLNTVQHSLLLGQCFQIPQGAVCRPSSTKHFITCLDLRRRDSVKLKRKGESCRRLARLSSQLRFYQLQNSHWQNQLNWFLNVTIRYGQYEHWALMKKRWYINVNNTDLMWSYIQSYDIVCRAVIWLDSAYFGRLADRSERGLHVAVHVWIMNQMLKSQRASAIIWPSSLF